MSINSVMAGIVSYNADVNRLLDNIQSIKNQVDKVIVIDNNSKNIDEIRCICEKENVYLLCNEENQGIAYALNQMLQYAKFESFHWCITLDQDSIVPKNFIDAAKPFLNENNIGQIVPQIYECETGDKPNLDVIPNGELYQEVTKSITSASITNTLVWEDVGGFDNDLFIDYVDFDYSIKLRIKGYKIIRMNEVLLNHQLGESINKNLIIRKVRVANHSAFRKYYICRNIVIFIKRYRKSGYINSFNEILRISKTIIFVILFEKDKMSKLSSCLHGVHDGIRYNVKN